MSEKKEFKSVLDYRSQFEDIIDALVPDIEFSYSAIMNNSTIQTYFNMLSMEYYGYEYAQLLRLNNLKFKLSERTLNLTILEVVYNIINEIVNRKWRYSEYIAYDMYVLPLRIKKYVKAMNYRFLPSETASKKYIEKLISSPARAVIEEIIDTYHDDRINNIITSFRACGATELENKVNLFKNLAVFIWEAKSIVFERFGEQFGEKYYKEIKEINTYKSEELTDKQIKHLKKNINWLFEVGMVIVLMMGEAVKAGIWDKIKEIERRRLETEEAKKAIEEANQKLIVLKKMEEKDKDFVPELLLDTKK